MAAHVRDLDDSELSDSLDWNRKVVVRKLAGLTFDQATAIETPTGVTLLGIVKHLTWVEWAWFEHHFLGIGPGHSDVAATFGVDPSVGVSDVIDGYHRACARSRAIVAEASSLEAQTITTHWYFGIVTLRWILLHMLRETARHAGHLDILRELTDGRTGDD